jgi:hypothetical protein
MDSQKLNDILHSTLTSQHYKAKAGDLVRIDLPKIPLTRFTEFLQLEKKKKGDLDCFIEQSIPPEGEGSLLPTQIVGRAVCPGKVHIILRAVDSLSGQEIPDVEPIDIIVEVQGD